MHNLKKPAKSKKSLQFWKLYDRTFSNDNKQASQKVNKNTLFNKGIGELYILTNSLVKTQVDKQSGVKSHLKTKRCQKSSKH